MPKTAIIELDTTIAHLRVYTNMTRSVIASHDMVLPEVGESQLLAAATALFDERVRLLLPNLKVRANPRGSKFIDPELEEKILTALGWGDWIVQESPYAFKILDSLEREIDQHVMHGLDEQLRATIGPDIYYAWHRRPVGTAIVMEPGGLLINLDRLNMMSGVVELDINEHWEQVLSEAEREDLETQRNDASVFRTTTEPAQKRYDSRKVRPNRTNDVRGGLVAVGPSAPVRVKNPERMAPQERAEHDASMARYRNSVARLDTSLEDLIHGNGPVKVDTTPDTPAVRVVMNGKDHTDVVVIPQKMKPRPKYKPAPRPR